MSKHETNQICNNYSNFINRCQKQRRTTKAKLLLFLGSCRGKLILDMADCATTLHNAVLYNVRLFRHFLYAEHRLLTGQDCLELPV